MSAGTCFGVVSFVRRTIRFTQSMLYPGMVDKVVTMYLTPSYLKRHFSQFVVGGSSTVSAEGQRVSFVGTVRLEFIPAAAVRFAKPDLHIAFAEEWTTSEVGASLYASVAVDGAPVSAKTTSTPAGTEEGCIRMVTDNVLVRVPLLGGRIEKEAMARLGRVVEREQALVTQWLEEHR